MSTNSTTFPSATRSERSLMLSLLLLVAALAVVALLGFIFIKPPAEMLEGQAEATSIRISGKLPGRVVRLYVGEGQHVSAGDTLVHIHSSLAEARMYQAEAVSAAAAAQRNKVEAGLRAQEVQSAYDLWQQTAASLTLAQKSYERMEELYRRNVVSEQRRDEARAAYEAARAGENAAQSQYQMAREGARRQDRESAQAMANAAAGGVMEVEALLQDQYLTAPCSGIIDVVYPNESELVALGAPIMSLLKVDDKWITFNVREHMLAGLTLGREVQLTIPALDRNLRATVYYVRNRGDYATWRATKATGEWDSRTFEVRLRPTDAVADLRPGMTVLWRNPNQ